MPTKDMRNRTYKALEFHNGRVATFKSYVYSFGMLFLELLTGGKGLFCVEDDPSKRPIIQDLSERSVKKLLVVNKSDIATIMNMLPNLHHSNIVRFFGFCTGHNEEFLLYEYVSKGLKNFLDDPLNPLG
ncbi:hypothetical protein M9H77_06521 [Catharanthus roseus]|uniref:Uncharacterized protein n=1 Tax=Catharanthus roseus TaxID=4058 RepID=A0ACC0BSB5_CATRO|nr:hypothetical protein M9H77_06521 [Catharanthus roseus]